MQKLFISYSRKDMDFARKLAGDLEKAGYDVWWDITDLRGGDDWVRTIPEAISSSQFVLVVLTPNSLESEWVRKEYTQALSLRKKIIPIMLVPSSVPFALNTINFVNFATGEYTDNYKKLLDALDFTGEPPVVKPIEKSMFSNLPLWLRKFGIPIVIAIILLLFFVLRPQPNVPVETPSTTPFPSSSATPTQTPAPATFTASVTTTPSPTPTSTKTATPTITLTASPTNQPFEVLSYCINSLYANTINVRSGPGTNYGRQGEPLIVGKCLTFRAHNQDETWLLIAPDQADSALQQYEGGWIFRELLGLGVTGPIDLPAVTLTPTSTASMTPTVTATFTRTFTPTPTDTPTDTPTYTPTLTEADTPIPTDTPTPTP
ncbi:MAG: toll/interleukin-1 receptor domain-containing protein [Chloroflexota bacterium]